MLYGEGRYMDVRKKPMICSGYFEELGHKGGMIPAWPNKPANRQGKPFLDYAKKSPGICRNRHHPGAGKKPYKSH